MFVPLPTQPQSPPNPSLSQSSASGSGAIFSTLVVLILGGVGLAFLVGFLLKRRGPVDPVTELSNDTVTVSQIQVALVAHAGSLQQALSTLALQADTRTPEGLLHLLQESALIVLRHSESWTHVYAESQTVPNLDIAQKVFNQMAIAERSKMSAETLVNVGGRVQQQSVTAPGLEEGPAAYIVVTLLMGTAHDQPLFGEIKTVEALQSALSEIAALTADYLCVLEVLWSPQSAEDSLTYDELLTEYSDLVQL
ncbi:DUF1517 domain-containing protein [Lyngbya confervoides]|uniref:DUF1517 domain-containing protein n=1 Tax=Lyngbya confervoides BDU141951 TaxID=1574623 RepID=A0ABD4T545_9CYAN|nr:DUF1517 domain-containing protein [Lyngbya confervoides]MCM1983561.1 DUF1517 domain-containing protein [Lyngbya confervoides BDU141951]